MRSFKEAIKFENDAHFIDTLTLYIPVLPADNLWNRVWTQIKNVGPDLDPNGLALLWYSWKKFLKMLILRKKSTDDNLFFEKLTSMKR